MGEKLGNVCFNIFGWSMLVAIVCMVAVAIVGTGILMVQGAFILALPECVTEDSTNCHWTGASGNGIGREFIAVGDVVWTVWK